MMLNFLQDSFIQITLSEWEVGKGGIISRVKQLEWNATLQDSDILFQFFMTNIHRYNFLRF